MLLRRLRLTRFYCLVVNGTAIAPDLVMPHTVAALPTAIAGIALHGVDHSILHPFHDAHMIGNIVLRPRGAFFVIAIGNPPLLLSSCENSSQSGFSPASHRACDFHRTRRSINADYLLRVCEGTSFSL